MLVLTGKGEKTLRDGGFPKNTVIFPDLAFAASRIADRRLTRIPHGIGAALVRFRALPADRHAAVRTVGAAARVAAAGGAVSIHHALVCAEPLGGTLDLRHPKPRDRDGEHSGDTAYRRVQAQLDVGNAVPVAIPAAARVRREKGAASVPFFGWAFRLASPITIDRKAGQDAMVQISAQGRERFAQGFWIILYPEGTRIPVGKRVRYKTGAARLAIEMQVPILPIAHNAGWLWPKGVMGKRPGVDHDVDRQTHRIGWNGRAATDAGGRVVDRGRSVAARTCMSAPEVSRRQRRGRISRQRRRVQ